MEDLSTKIQIEPTPIQNLKQITIVLTWRSHPTRIHPTRTPLPITTLTHGT